MAYERVSDTKVKGDSLESFVANLSTLFKRQVAIRNAEDELRFNTAVLEDNLTLEDQLKYRQDQLKRVSDDPEERKRVRGEVSNLKQRIEQKAFSDAYAAKLTEFQAGMASIDTVIQFLKNQQSATTNQTVLDTIRKNLTDAEGQKFSLTQSLIKNNTEYATNTKNVSVIDNQLSKVRGYRAQALLSGNDQLVSVYDLQIQGLEQAKTSAEVNDDVLSLGAVTSTGGYNAVALLDAMNQKIAGAASSGPVSVGGTTYASAKDFWTFKRDSYLSDSGSGGFFQSLSTELKNDLSNLQSKNALDTAAVRATSSNFDALAARPELANYARQIDLYKQDVVQTGANYLADTISNEFTRTLDVGKAVATLTGIKSLGANLDDAFTKILTANASTKNAQVQGILSAAQQAMQNDPNLTPDQAIAQAVAAGAGTVVSPQQAATQTEAEIAGGAVKTAAAGQGTTDPRTTVPQPSAPVQPANTPAPSGNLTAATIAALPNLAPGMRSEDVRTLQTYLIQQGFAIPDGATGFYGPQTQAAVTAFQTKNKIDTQGNPGYFGPLTKSYISQPIAPIPAPSPTPTPAPTPAPVATPTPTATQSSAPTPAPVTQPVSSGYTFNKLANGNVEIMKDGQRISTGTASYAKSLGYTGT